MDLPTKGAHKFDIWELADSKALPAYGMPDAGNAGLSAHGLAHLPHHSASRAPRSAARPFRGKCMLPDGRELSCKATRVGPERIDVAYHATFARAPSLSLEAKIALDLEYFGIIHGVVRAADETGFSVAPDIIYHGMLVAKLAQIGVSEAGPETERSASDRLTARVTLRNPACIYRLIDSDAVIYHAKIALLSYKVATLRTTRIQRAGARVLLGWRNVHRGTVAQSFETGFAIEFDEMLVELHENLFFG